MLQTLQRPQAARHRGGMITPDRYGSLGELLRDALIQFKSETALIEARRRTEVARLTYADFRKHACDLIAALESRGIGPGDRVAILMSNQSRWLLAAYATFHRGAVLVPLDYKLGPAEQRSLLRHSNPKALVIEGGLRARLGDEPLGVPLVLVSEPERLASDDADWETLPRANKEPTLQPRKRDDLACIVYSSGTGGTPKGCQLTHGNYLAQYASLQSLFELRVGHRYFSILPTNHAIDFMCGFIGPFGGGATVVHQRQLRPELVRWTMKEYGITHMALVPLILESFARALEEQLGELGPARRGAVEALAALNGMLTERAASPRVSRQLLRPIHRAFGGCLEQLFCGGAFVDPRHVEILARYGLPVIVGYGLTEACTVATVNDLRPFRADSVGRAAPGVEVQIDRPNAEGVGEVLLRGATVMKGYLDEPELTAATLKDGWLYTGDLGWLDASQHLHLVGRAKNMIVTAGGKNVYPEDVEGAFDALEAEELVVMATGFVWGADLANEGLLLIARQRGAPSVFVERVAQANRGLPEHKRVQEVLFVEDPMPRTASMKIKRSDLANQIRQRYRPGDATPLAI